MEPKSEHHAFFERRAGLRSELNPALDNLLPKQRTVIELRIIQGFNIAETAELLKMPQEAVKKLQARGLARLRRFIEASRDRETDENPHLNGYITQN